MKKRILATMLAGVLTFGLAACGGNGASASNSAPPSEPAAAATDNSSAETAASDTAASGEKVELTVWESLQGPDEFIKQAGAKFTEQNPNITIKFVNVELGDASTQITLDGPAGVGPDLFAIAHDRLGSLVTDGHVAVVPDSSLSAINNCLDGCVKAVTYDGKVYGYPISTETYSLFYNKDLCPNPPKTWDDVITFAKDFNAKNPGKYGFVMDTGNAYYSIIFTSSNSNQLFGPSGTDMTNTYINSPASVQGMQEFIKLKEILPVAAADLATAQVDALFQSGQAAMHITGPWNFKPFKDAGINFGVTTLPALPGNSTPAMSFSGTRCMLISNYSKHKDAAAKFAEFLVSNDMQTLRYDITGALPSVSLTLSGEYGDYATGMLEQMKYSYPMPSIPQMAKFWDAMNNASANIWNGNGSNIQSELDAANQTILGE